MLRTLTVAARDRSRLLEFVQLGTRFGSGFLLARLGLTTGSASDKVVVNSDPARRPRLAVRELGPPFVKLGQILAIRGALLSPTWIAELERLHSQAPILPFGNLRVRVEETLDEPPKTVFAAFDTTPRAAASMTHVHRATSHDERAGVEVPAARHPTAHGC